jgi:hypothetical protein
MSLPLRSSSPKSGSGRHGGVSSLEDGIKAWLRASGLGARSRQGPVYAAWIDAAGKDLARHAKPVRFERGELCVEVDSAVHLHELKNFTGEDIRLRANAKLERPEIARIAFRLKR